MPLILAHRGANKRAPQNTIPAFKSAIEHGADGVEFDVQMTSDGVLVICHNFTVDETSNGTGYVHEHTFEELRALDFGSWFSDEFKGTLIPTLDETLDTVKDMTVINIEIKRPQPETKKEVVHKTIAAVRAHGLTDKVIFSSFDFETIDLIKAEDDTLKCGLLYDPEKEDCDDRGLLYGQFVKIAKAHKADALHPYFKLTRYPFFYTDMCHRNGIAVNVWGIGKKTAKYLERWKKSKVDIIITDEI